ncbi:hypothetical protein MTP10_30595 [Nonomuraea sp. 3-1Str]|uniref:hypothetical protein n=1 Tax=Nonomuraea sp. 3-1Str TaxID=2929801 RepID=UPI00285C25F4|nr:hypothetical protein [Nonomuraea sp. 3-1Str]MDR8413069.1 hypothetical protein [Nonomuraea sp. 3-1Str]
MKLKILKLLDRDTHKTSRCLIKLVHKNTNYEITVTRAWLSRVIVRSQVDFEDCLVQLRRELERQHLLLLCNRYRRNAFVSSMARQMSGGLACYLVDLGVPADPATVVGSVDPAPSDEVAMAREQEKFIEEWITSCAEE